MKIGIITWYKSTNFGTNLQAIALQKYLRNKGYEVKIVNYEVVSSLNSDVRNFWQKVAYQPCKYVLKYAQWKYKKELHVRDQKINNAMIVNCILTDKIFNESELIDICNQFDLLICGGDQIWNPNWYHRFYFADYDDIKTRRISYAPSMGVNTIPPKLRTEIKRGIERFDKVSIREEKGAELLNSFTKVNPTVVVDPTLLLSAEEWKEIFMLKNAVISSGEYVLSMFLTDKMEHWKAARNFVRKKGMRHVIIPYGCFSYLQIGEIHADAGIQDMLALINSANYVLTDSFHITVFSIIFQRQFYAFQRFEENDNTSQNSRIKTLLKISGLKERYISYGCKFVSEKMEIDYNYCEKKLRSEILKSKEFLHLAVDNVLNEK